MTTANELSSALPPSDTDPEEDRAPGRELADLRARVAELEGELRTAKSRGKDLETASADLRRIVDNAEEAVMIVAESGQILDVNPQAALQLGYGPEELQQRTLFDVSPRVTPERLAYIFDHLADCGQLSLWGTHRRRDGSEYPVMVRCYAVQDAAGGRRLVAAARDRSEALELERYMTLLEKAVEQSIDGIVVVTMTGEIECANRAWSRMHGFERALPVAEGLRAFHDAEVMREVVLPMLAEAKQVGFAEGLVEHVRRDGSRFPAWTTATRFMDESGNPLGIVLIARDVLELEAARDAERQARRRAEDADATKARFLSNMSHELRTPLNAIIGFSKLLMSRPADAVDPNAAYLGRIAGAGENLLAMTDEILELTQLSSERQDPSRSAVDLDALLRRVCAQYDARALDAGLTLSLEVPTALEPIETDPTRLGRLVGNLVDNGIRFTERGSVTVRALADATGRRAVALEVTDTGIGMAADETGLIFQPFHQVDGSDSRSHFGAGLGLTSVWELCRSIGYWIEVESQPGEGTTMRVLFDGRPSQSPDRNEPTG